jgi:hypothetical protein
MRGRILSLRWRTLTRIGFIVENRFIGLRKIGNWLNGFSRHPATLVLFGFVLTGLIGNYLAQLQGERREESDSVVKSMDEIRASFDELSVGFSDFQFRATRLIRLEESGASADAIASAHTQYDAAVQKWKESLAANGPRIGGRYLQMMGLNAMGLVVSNIDMDTDLFDECLNNNVRKQGSDPREVSLECKNKYTLVPYATIPGVTVESRMWLLSTCARYFIIFMRPDPQSDFDERGTAAKSFSRVVGLVCSPLLQNDNLQELNEYFSKEFKLPKAPMKASPPAATSSSR